MSAIEMLTERGKLVDDFLLKMLRLGASDELYKIAEHQVVSGGKRARPAMTILCCEAVGGDIKVAIPAAAGIELIHNYTLIFDDVIDHSDLRRGYPTVRALYGDVMSFLVGMHYREAIFEAVRRSVRSRRIEMLLSWTIRRIIEGERLDVLFEQAGRDSEYISRMMYRDISEDDYLRMIEAKTAVLFEAACEAGGIVGGGKPTQIDALSRYGLSCGVAFQIQDDILDVVGETERLGKEAGKDIREHKLGNITVLYSLEELSKNSRDKLLMMLSSPELSDSQVSEAVEIVLSTNALKRAEETSREYIAKAKSGLKVLPESEAKSMLMSVADFVVERSF
ncbi:MAG: polyprenyl synthetase family protein [Candidatus Bathyarchaeia archaeon]